jgi:hypothetical protein
MSTTLPITDTTINLEYGIIVEIFKAIDWKRNKSIYVWNSLPLP